MSEYTLESGQVLRNVHDDSACAERPSCVIHRPSHHSMAGFPRYWRDDWGGFMERTCPHGIGHPDPDQLAYFKAAGIDGFGVHGCDGCCR